MLKLDRNNIQSFCRICLDCLQSTAESVTASSVKYNIRETPNLMKLLILCTTLNINEDTDAAYPQQVCQKCYMSLQEIQRFRDLALQSNDVLRGIVENADSVEVTPNENSTEHEELAKAKCEYSTDQDFSNDHFEASQTELSESYFVMPQKEIEYDEFLDNSSEIKIEPAMFDNESYISPAVVVAAKVKDCSADTVDHASTSTAAAKRKRSDDGDTDALQCPLEDCKVEFKTKKALETHTKYVHGTGDFRDGRFSKPRRPSSSDKEERLDGKLHILRHCEDVKSKDCSVCSNRKILGGRRQTNYFCDTCSRKPGLHIGDCFESKDVK